MSDQLRWPNRLNDIVNSLFHIQYFDTLLLKHSCVQTLASISVGGGDAFITFTRLFSSEQKRVMARSCERAA